jgi:zinc protease
MDCKIRNRTENCFAQALIVLVLAGLILSAGAGCQKSSLTAGKSSLAAGSSSLAIQDTNWLDYRQIKLENGMDVITLEDFFCPIVTVQIWYHVGSKDEQEHRHGFAHMFEHIMFRGTDRLGPTDHFNYIHRVGGTSNGYTGFDRTVYLETLPAGQLELALWLEAERMAFLKIDQDSFDTERKVVEEERRMGLNQPYGSLMENLFAEIYKVHPYSSLPIGNIADLRASSVQDLRDFWMRYYVPNNATLIIAGAVKHEDAQKLAKKYFGWIPKYTDPPRVTVHEPEPNGPRAVVLKEDNAPAPGAGVVYRTVSAGNKDSVVFDIISQILGSGNSSRLYRELVAQKQLAVQAEAASWSLQQDGLFGAGALLPPFGADANSVLEIIENHIARLRTEPVSERELTKAKNQMLRGMVTDNLMVESKAKALGNAAIDVGDVSQVNRQMNDIRRVTADDILRVAKAYLTPQRVLEVKVERNLLGMVLGGNKEEQAKITAEPEKQAPKPGRPGEVRSEDFPKDPPVAKIAPAKLTPKFSSRQLENGLKVLIVPNHEVPFVSVQLGLLAGGWTENKPGTAAMAAGMLTKGTYKYSEGLLADELETYAINLGGGADMDTAMVSMSCLTEHISRAMGLMGEVVLEPNFPPAEFEKLRKQVLTSLAVASAEPEYVAEREFRQRLYGKHPYSRTATGEIEDVNALSIEDLKVWWNKLARPDMAVLIFAGDIDEDRAVELARSTFGKWQAHGAKPQVKLPQLPQAGQTHIYLVDRPGSIQSQIRVGQLGITRHEDGYFTSRVVSNYFGWAFDSRLNQSIRVAKGLTYSVWGSYIAQRFAGEFDVGTFSKTETTAKAVQAVLDEIGRLKTEGPSQKELDDSRSYILGSFVKNRETPQQIAGDLWLIESQQLGRDYLDRLLIGIANTQKTDCERLVLNTIKPAQLVVVVVGEAEKFKSELEKIAPVTVVEN